jgi:hypothetical protein
MGDPVFATVHDLGLSAEEAKVWGGLPTTPDTYPRLDGMTPTDAALAHMVLVCLDRLDYDSARRCAARMTDPKMREARLALIAYRGGGV